MEKNLFLSLGGGNEIGASSYFLQIGKQKFLLDAGLRIHHHTALPEYANLYHSNLLDGLWDLSSIFISHAHLDHIGSLPYISNEAHSVPIYTTQATYDLMELVLKNTKRESPSITSYKNELILQSLAKTNIVVPFKPFWINDVKVTFFPSGHILGACSILLESPDINVLYTGDFTNFDQLTVMAMDLPSDFHLDVLITETTYGYNSDFYIQKDIESERLTLIQHVASILENDGIVVIPAFSLGRTQEIIKLIEFAIENRWMNPFPVYVDGLAISVSEIYEKYGINIFTSNIQKAPSYFYDDLENFCGIIICSSGMLKEYSASKKYANKILSRLNSTIFFTAYLDEESLLYKQKEKLSYFEPSELTINSNIYSFKLSSHADFQGILRLIEKYRPKKTIFVHGVPKSCTTKNIMQEAYSKFGNISEIIQSINGVSIFL